jgi:DNA-binding SARP family transcriptional activator
VHAAAAADSSGDAFLQVVSLVALAEFDDEQRDRLYDKAVECSNAVAAPRLSEAVLALAARSPNAGTLDAFVNRRLRALRSSRPKLDVRFADGSVRVDGSPIKLRPRESALLFIIAENESGTSFNELSDRLWPDVDGDAARNALHVCLHRLRKALGDDTAIVRDASRYRLRDEAAVDLWQLRSILKRVAHDSILSDEERMHLCEAFEALHSGRRERPTEQQWFSGIERTIARLTCDVGWCLVEDALIRREFERAQFIATSRIDEQIASGDRAGALETYESYRDLMARLSLGEPPSSLQTLVAPLETNE